MRFYIVTAATTRIHGVISQMMAASIVKRTKFVNIEMDKEIFAEKYEREIELN
jgi:hypothetical protein